MPRTLISADAYITNIERNFAVQVYTGATLRSRGIAQPPCYNKLFPVFQNALDSNSIYGALTELERDSIIDYLLR